MKLLINYQSSVRVISMCRYLLIVNIRFKPSISSNIDPLSTLVKISYHGYILNILRTSIDQFIRFLLYQNHEIKFRFFSNVRVRSDFFYIITMRFSSYFSALCRSVHIFSTLILSSYFSAPLDLVYIHQHFETQFRFIPLKY